MLDPNTGPDQSEAEDTAAPEGVVSDAPAVERAEDMAAPKDGAERRIADTRARREAERRAQAAEARAADLEQQLRPHREPVADPNAEPDPSGYQDDASYIRALARFEARQIAQEDRKAAANEAKHSEEKARVDAWAEKGRAAYPDFDEVLDAAQHSEWVCSQTMFDALTDSEAGAGIARFLYLNPEEAARISRLGTAAQVREIDKLEAKVSPPSGNRVSKAPSPPENQARGTGSDTRDHHLERLQDEADRTGDRTKVIAYRRSKRPAG